MSKLHENLLAHANELLLSHGRPSQISLRRSVSASYYAAWHCLCDVWASRFDLRIHESLVRSPNHKQMSLAAGRLKSGKNEWLGRAHVCSVRMKELSENFIYLQRERHSADYDTAAKFQKRQAQEAYRRADDILGTVKWAQKKQSPSGHELDALLLDCLGIKPRS